MSSSSSKVGLGPDPLLINRKEVDALYDTLAAVISALDSLQVDYIVTGGSLLGAVRQHSLLFCDDDVDIAILGQENYQTVSQNLASLIGPDYQYAIKPWEGGDKIRPRRMTSVFVDLFCIRKYDSEKDLRQVIGIKKNEKDQSEEYVQNILDTIQTSAYSQEESSPLYPLWHFNTRKAIEMWPKEVYREHELFPLCCNYKFGPIVNVKGPRMPVLLLKRAFGSDCFQVYYKSASHKDTIKPKHVKSNGKHLPPLLTGGGAWEGGKRTPLEDEHYLPMQPMLKAKRRPTLHDKEELFRYLAEQSKQEEDWLKEANAEQLDKMERRPDCTVYMDGVFDLFHVGHLEAIRQCANLGNKVIIGVTGAADAADYKRPPIISQDDRVAIVGALKEVDAVVCPCPLVVTKEFMEEHGIDLVVHGFANEADAERQKVFFEAPMEAGRFKRISYYKDLSTTDIINKIKALPEESTSTAPQNTPSHNPQWFGACLAAATNNSTTIPFDPFPLSLRQVVEPHIRKATTRREQALGVVRKATGASRYDEILSQFTNRGLAQERDFEFDTVEHNLRSAFLRSTDLPESTDLSRLHECPGAKELALRTLTIKQPSHFQLAFDKFVHKVCAPRLSSFYDCEEIYYQAFPCIRVIQPDDFSIGPHSDIAYGHHPCSINFYVPLTEIGGTSALFLESRPGSEDWHPIEGDYGLVKHFAGAICTHWTPENKTSRTRVSIDFRLIPGPIFRALVSGPGGKLDVYRQTDGYYSCSRKFTQDDGTIVWERKGTELLRPDARVGFPWTVRDWDSVLKRTEEKRNGRK